jgi:AraC-like DNA-binding protein
VPSYESPRYREIVARAEEIARANLETCDGLEALGRATGVGPRTLARAFRAVHGTTPLQYLHTLRLAAARRTLLSREPAATSVTEVGSAFANLADSPPNIVSISARAHRKRCAAQRWPIRVADVRSGSISAIPRYPVNVRVPFDNGH